MANTDVFARLAGFVAEIGQEVTVLVTDPDARRDLLARAGVLSPPAGPPADPAAAQRFAALVGRANANGALGLELLADLAVAMTDLVSLVQQATNGDSENAAWNVVATCFDIVAVDRLRASNPALVALLKATHLLSDDRLLFADLFRARDHWGSFLLGTAADEGEAADNWSLILAAAFAVVGAFIPQEDDQGEPWRTDMLFGWDPDPGSPAPRAERVLQRMATMRFAHRHQVGEALVEENFGFSAAVVPPSDGGWGLFLALNVGGGLKFPIGQHLELALEAKSPDAVDAFFGDPPFVTSGVNHTTAKALVRRKQETADHWTIGPDDGTHLEIGTFSVGFELADPVRFLLSIGGGALVIPKSEFGFMGSLMPAAGVSFNFETELMIDTRGHVSFAGGAGMTVTLPVNRSLAILRVRSLTLAVLLEGSNDSARVSIATTVGFGLDFGAAFKINVDNIGARLDWTLPSSPPPAGSTVPIVHGNLGPAGDLGLSFVPPRGIGVLINAGPIKGGGFFYFDPAHRTYAGVLEASLSLCGTGLQIKAAGLLRETDEGWDFVLILSAQFTPAIEIFLGLTLNGVGGMLGINVTVAIDKLRASLHDGGINRLLFPDDPVANAPAIIATMISVFPHAQGGVVAGPMLQLGWGRPTSFVTLSVAVVVVTHAPALLLILGRLRVAAPDPRLPVVNLQVDFFGVINFEEPSFSFEASLVDSRLAMYPVTGDLVVRAGPRGFLLSAGGFHPQFTPPADMPTLRRIAVDISANPVTRIHAEAYLAVTSNTFQVGMRAGLDIDAGVASIRGELHFDALVQWEPHFYFSFELGILLELRVGGHSIAGVTVDLLLEGPGPWHARGRASLHLLFFTVHARFEVTWGEADAVSEAPRVDASLRVAQALGVASAWTSVAPDGDAWVTFRETDRPDLGVHPYGRLSVRQQAVPIGVPITRIGQSRVVGDQITVTLTPTAGSPSPSSTMGLFAPTQFSDLTDDQRLSRPSFERYQDGMIFGASQTIYSAECVSSATYETVYIPDPAPRKFALLHADLFLHALEFGSVARSGLHFAALNNGPEQRVRLADETFQVVIADRLVSAGAGTFTSMAAATAAADLLTDRRLLVVSAHEAVT